MGMHGRLCVCVCVCVCVCASMRGYACMGVGGCVGVLSLGSFSDMWKGLNL